MMGKRSMKRPKESILEKNTSCSSVMMLFHDTLNSPPFPLLWGHVLQPAYDGHAVAIPVAVVCEARAKVFLRIVGQSLSID